MASKQARQERLLERQRGAGRQVKNFDIGLVLTAQSDTSLQPRRSGRSSKTPQPNLFSPPKSLRRNPAAELAPHRPSRPTPAAQLTLQPSSPCTPTAHDSEAKRSRGRPPSATTSSKRPRVEPEEDAEDAGPSDLQGRTLKKSKTKRQPIDAAKQIDARIPANVLARKDPHRDVVSSSATRKRKKRKSIGQQSTKRAKARPSEGEDWRAPTNVAGSTLDDDIQDQLRRESSDLNRAAPSEPVTMMMPIVEPTRGTGITRQQRRKKRVSIGQRSQRKPKQALVAVKEEPVEESGVAMDDAAEHDETQAVDDQVDSDDNDTVGHTEDDENGDRVAKGDAHARDDEDEDDEDEDEELKPAPKPTRKDHLPKTKRKKRKSIGQQKSKKVPRGDTALASTSRQDTSMSKVQVARRKPQEQSDRPQPRRKAKTSKSRIPQAEPKAQKQTIRPSKKQTSANASKTDAPRGPASAMIPITVYRPPTSISPVTSDEEGMEPVAPASKTFNAVDVLAQITLERLSNIAGKLSAQPSVSRTQRKALGLYSKEVESRLRQLSQALDLSKVLEAKVKKLGKEERALKAEIKGVEMERKGLKERREEQEGRKRRGELEALLERIEKAARKGWEMERRTAEVREKA